MAPLLVTALIGVGVKIVTDLVMAGVKETVRPGPATASFATALDRARFAAAAAPSASETRAALSDAGLAERSRLLAIDPHVSLPAATRAHGAASYRRLDTLAPSM